jgi:hypothetical protein
MYAYTQFQQREEFCVALNVSGHAGGVPFLLVTNPPHFVPESIVKFSFRYRAEDV